MRILTLAIVGLAFVTAGCASRSTTATRAAPAPATAQSGATADSTTAGTGDRIDQWAAVVERERAVRR